MKFFKVKTYLVSLFVFCSFLLSAQSFLKNTQK